MSAYDEAYAGYTALVEKTLEEMLDKDQTGRAWPVPEHLLETMRYSVMAGGKRVRPVLMLACAEMLDVPMEEARRTACAIEMIHTYSLIHDDLPAMDDDELRRGRPTNHVVFGEGAAVLAGDGLLNNAYEWMLEEALRYPKNLAGHVRAVNAVAHRAGVAGMIAGQSLDLLSEHTQPDESVLNYIHLHKTADLLTAPLEAAAFIADADEKGLEALRHYGRCVGVAFQIDDDLLDIEGDAALLGKKTGMDEERGKMTWPGLVGINEARKTSARLWREAEESLAVFGEAAWFLKEFARRLSVRKK